MSGVNTLKHGYIWRVGDGTKINIWSDAWVPGSADRKVITPRGQNIISKVGDLIDPVTRQWDEELINQTFWPVYVHQVMSITLPAHEMEDFVAWSYNKGGFFSVRSAYHVEWNHQHGRKLRRTNGVEAMGHNGIGTKSGNCDVLQR